MNNPFCEMRLKIVHLSWSIQQDGCEICQMKNKIFLTATFNLIVQYFVKMLGRWFKRNEIWPKHVLEIHQQKFSVLSSMWRHVARRGPVFIQRHVSGNFSCLELWLRFRRTIKVKPEIIEVASAQSRLSSPTINIWGYEIFQTILLNFFLRLHLSSINTFR